MKKVVLLLFLSAWLFSCQNIVRPEKPKNLIPKEIMVDVLVDSYLSNAIRSKSYQEVRDENVRLEKYIYEKYSIDSLQFSQSNAYYSSDLEDYTLMLDKVEEKLQALKNEGNKSEDAPDLVPTPIHVDPDDEEL